MTVANVALSDSFDVWRVRINQGFVAIGQANEQALSGIDSGAASFAKANSANVLAYSTGAGANGWSNLVGSYANTYAASTTSISNNWANTVTGYANTRAIAIGVAGNSYTNYVGAAANAYAVSLTGSTVSFDYSNTVGSRANAWANTVGTAGNNYAISLTGSTVSFNYANSVGARANTWANTVGTYSNTYAATLATAGNNYSAYLQQQANIYTGTLAGNANNWANTLSTRSNTAIGAAFDKANNSLQNTAFTLNGAFASTGAIVDYLGNVRKIPVLNKTSAYVLQASDSGRAISITTGGVTLNQNTLAANDAVTIFNNSGSNQTLTAGAGVTLYLSGTALTGSRTIGQRGLATLLCVSTNVFVVSGTGVS